MLNDDGYEWTENFDGLIIINNNKYYFNLKFVCDREVYHFIKYQIEHLITFNITDTYFINILDGFHFLINKEKNKKILNYIFIGSLSDYQKKMNSIFLVQ